ncbi:MAG: THUMP domain-containing class I SAM-dependent RNA methyltransferase [Chitinophagales bacterium]
MSLIDLTATAAFGLEAVVAREVKDLGYTDTSVETGKVTFRADPKGICRTNLWLRSAERVFVKMGEFSAKTFTELFDQTVELPWADWMPENAAFPVEGKSVKSQLHSVPDCQAIVKKAVVESMKRKYRRQWFPETGPRFTIEVALLKDVATLSIDTSGRGLHKRGYRKLSAKAPLKETLAAGMVNLSYWNPERVLVDPFCGSGTIPIETALIGLNLAPGLNRDFAAEEWPNVPAWLWKQAREEARDLARRDRKLKIRGMDIDREVLSLARYHAREAGVEGCIHWQQMPFQSLQTKDKYGLIICNPPYGQRLEDMDQVEALYQEMGKICRDFESWSFYILTAHRGFERLFGRKADRNRKLYNGRIECHYYQYNGPRPPRREASPDSKPD